MEILFEDRISRVRNFHNSTLLCITCTYFTPISRFNKHLFLLQKRKTNSLDEHVFSTAHRNKIAGAETEVDVEIYSEVFFRS